MSSKNAEYILPTLPLPKGIVTFPGLVIPLQVSDKMSVQLVNDVLSKDKILTVFATKDVPPGSNCDITDIIYDVGCRAMILKMLRLPDGVVKFLIQSISRVKLIETIQKQPYLITRVVDLQEEVSHDAEESALMRSVLQEFEKLVSMASYLPDELRLAAVNTTEPSRLADLIGANLNIPPEQKQQLLQELSSKKRLNMLIEMIKHEITVLQLTHEIQKRTTEEVEKAQREYYLREQLRQIQRELGEDDVGKEIEELRQKIEKACMPPEAHEAATKELERLARMHPSSAEYTVSRTYIDWLIEMPWANSSVDRIDIAEAKKILNEDHHDLDEVKERILEFLAVRKMKPDVKSPILLFVGPPGVGKTSLGMSIARSMGREFVRISLGGMKDEAEIRGHRRTYVGALPGRIIQGIKRAKKNNPVFMLDEIDKIGSDFRGDPASALLEVLDPAQNFSFSDHYLDVPFDLSKVIFIATANYIDPIPRVLLDRMEVLHLSGYTDIEKLHIAKKFLIPKQLENHGLSEAQLQFSDEAISYIVNSYTQEAGVRNLDRAIASICRKTAKGIAEGTFTSVNVDKNKVREMLGPEKFLPEKILENPKPGVVVGLAWTPFGGEILMVEASLFPGNGHLVLTGSLGDVMKESAQIALSYVRSLSEQLGISEDTFTKNDIHIHVPAGAIPKDGPSAGVTIATALVSKIKNIPPKDGLAMTGEITLRGDVLAIGGLKEKALAAHRASIKKIIIPKDNKKDIPELPEEIRNSIEFIYADTVETILQTALGIEIGKKLDKKLLKETKPARHVRENRKLEQL